MTRSAWILPLTLALVIAGCGGSDGGPGSSPGGGTTAYTKVTNDAAGEFASFTKDIASTAQGDKADSPAAWSALATRVDDLADRLKRTHPPTAESKAPLATLASDFAELGTDLRAIADAGGARAAGGGAVEGLSSDQEAIQRDLQKLPLY